MTHHIHVYTSKLSLFLICSTWEIQNGWLNPNSVYPSKLFQPTLQMKFEMTQDISVASRGAFFGNLSELKQSYQ